jgi:phage gp46-like protein
MTTDVQFFLGTDNTYDLGIDENGDLANGDFFDTSLLYSILGERRATESEVPQSEFRRGWIGNEFQDFENGSKVWLFEQSRATRTVLNGINTAVFNGLSWLIEDQLLRNITVNSTLENQSIMVEVQLERFNSKVEKRFFELWENTGVN